jgi:hypothetical protein
MSFVVTGTALVQCSFGAAPMPLTVLPQGQALALALPIAVTTDSSPILNVPPLGMCACPGNPMVAAAMGSPMPCVPSTLTWLPGQPNVLVRGLPVVTSDCKLLCTYGGIIQVAMPGQTVVQTG